MVSEPYRFIISYDSKFHVWGVSASDSTVGYVLGSYAFKELGQFETKERALEACERYAGIELGVGGIDD